MKRILIFCLVCLLLAGCSTPRGRQSSEDFVPSELPSTPVTAATRGEDDTYETSPSVRPQIGGPIKTSLSTEGDYTYEGETIHYRYELPFIDLSSSFAVGCNNEIEITFGNPIREAEAAMEEYEPLELISVGYTADIQGNILTVRITAVYADGEETSGVYSLNSITGAKVTMDEYLTVMQMSKSDFNRMVKSAVTARFEELAAEVGIRDTDVRYTTALNQSLSAAANPSLLAKYFTADGRVAMYVTIYLPNGASSREEIIVP